MIVAVGELLVTLAAGLMLLLVVWHKPIWCAFGAISIAGLLDCLELGAAGLDVGVKVYVDDAACLVLLLAGFLLLLRHRRGVPPDAVPCLLLLALVALSFGMGVSTFGLRQAGNSVRSLFAFAVPALTLMMLRPVLRFDAGRLARWLGWAGCCFCAVALLRWMGALPVPVSLEDELRGVVRSLRADHALVIGQAFTAALYVLIVERRKGWWWWAGAGMFGVVTLALQHRSVWAATAAGAAWLLFRTGRQSPLRWLGFGAAAIVALCFLVGADPTIAESGRGIVGSALSETQGQHSTWAWRVGGYTEATDRVFASELADELIGPPAGWGTNTGGSFASIHIHGRYIETLAYNGLAGASALLAWLVVLTRRSRHRARSTSMVQPLPRSSAALLQAILLSELLYFIPYGGGILQSAVLGLLWIAATQGTHLQRVWRFALVPARLLPTAN